MRWEGHFFKTFHDVGQGDLCKCIGKGIWKVIYYAHLLKLNDFLPKLKVIEGLTFPFMEY